MKQPLLLDRVADVANYIRRSIIADAALPGGPFEDDFSDAFDVDLPPHLEHMQVGTSMRGWDGVSPLIVLHRAGGSLSRTISEVVDIQFDCYGATPDEAFDAITYLRQRLAVAATVLPECTVVYESIGPLFLAADHDTPRFLCEWRLTFRT